MIAETDLPNVTGIEFIRSPVRIVFGIHHFPQQLLNRKTARKTAAAIYWRKNKVGAQKDIYTKCITEVLLKRIYNVFRE